MTDYYSVLGVSPDASADEIKTSYKALILKSHPDKNNESSDKFIGIAQAWQILRDPDLRKVYDSKQVLESSQIFAVSDSVHISEFELDDVTYYYSCRCQNDFMLEEQDVRFLQRFVSCTGCSQVIEVVYS